MKILISSYSPNSHASYGVIVRDLWSRLHKSGEMEIYQHAWFHKPAAEDSVPWPVFPTHMSLDDDGKARHDTRDLHGQLTFKHIVEKLRPDIVWNLSDIYMSRYLDEAKQEYRFKLVRWTLTEGLPIDPDNIPSLINADECVGITDYSVNAWQRLTKKNFKRIYHGVNTKLFVPVSEQEKNKLRDFNSKGVIKPDDFLITFVGRNQARKRPWLIFQILHYLQTGAWGWDAAGVPCLDAWDNVSRTHFRNPRISIRATPLNVKVWIHAVEDNKHWNFQKLREYWNVNTFFTSGLTNGRGLSTDDMATIYQMSDAISMITGAEGFGVPIIEAASCGVPAVVTDYSGCQEIARLTKGQLVPVDSYEPAPISHVHWANPNVAYAVAAFAKLYADKKANSKAWRLEAEQRREQTIKLFDYQNITSEWLSLLRDVHKRDPLRIIGGEV